MTAEASPRLARILAALFLLSLAAVGLARLHFGVDFTDEAFYAAIPHTFALGNEPFVHELAMQQTAALLTAPLVRTHRALTGSSDGIILMLRYAWFVLASLVAAAVFLLARRVAGSVAALVCSALPLAFVFASIPTLSYNSLGLLLFALAAVTGLYGSLTERTAALVVCGATAVAAAVAYPSMIIGAGFLLAAVYGALRREQRSPAALRALVYSWLAAGLVAFVRFATFGWDNLAASVAYMQQHRDVKAEGKLAEILAQIGEIQPYNALTMSVMVVALGAALLLPVRWRWIAASVLLAALACFDPFGTDSSGAYAVTYAAAFLSPVAFRARSQSAASRLTVMLLLPSGLLMAVVTALTSNNGFRNASIGAFTAVIGCLIVLFEGAHGRVLPYAAAALFIGALAVDSHLHVYRDAPLSDLQAAVTSGPYAGLRTSPERVVWLDGLATEIRRQGRDRRVVFYSHFPAGYLFLDAAPPVQTTWIPTASRFPAFDRVSYVRHLTAPENLPDVVFEMTRVPMDLAEPRTVTSLGDPLRFAFWRSGYLLVNENPDYAVYRRCERCRTDRMEAEKISDARHTLLGEYSGGAAVSVTEDVPLSGSIPNFSAGPYRLDLVLMRKGLRYSSVIVAAGADEREVILPPGRSGTVRVAAIVFPHVDHSEFSVRAAHSSGQRGFIAVDEMSFTSAPGAADLDGVCGVCDRIGSLRPRPITWEPEAYVTTPYAGPGRRAAATEWTRQEGRTSAGAGVVLTRADGAVLHGAVPGLRPGSYRVSVRVSKSSPDHKPAFYVTLGNVRRRFEVPADLPKGFHWLSQTFEEVRDGELAIVSIAQPEKTLVIDSVSIEISAAPPAPR